MAPQMARARKGGKKDPVRGMEMDEKKAQAACREYLKGERS
jgi:hypothetical protein